MRFLIADNSYKRRLNILTNGLFVALIVVAFLYIFLLLGEFGKVRSNLILYALVHGFSRPLSLCLPRIGGKREICHMVL